VNYLSLDLGRRHTGVAFCDAKVCIPLPLKTIHHEEDEELIGEFKALVMNRNVKTVVIGLPLMPDGTEGEETSRVHSVAAKLHDVCPECSIEFLDERETSKGSSKDPHANAALVLLSTFLERTKSKRGEQ
jgi:putative holliday junction resolvase